MAIVFGALANALLGNQATSDDDIRVLPYKCRDLVVVGRVKNEGYVDLPDDGHILGRARFAVTIKVKKVVWGRVEKQFISAVSVAHSQMREDKDFLMVLSRTNGGAYEVRTAQLQQDNPKAKLTERCH